MSRFAKVEAYGATRRWSYTSPRFGGGWNEGPTIDIESSISGDGDVMIRPPRGTAAFWIATEDVDEFCDILKEASKKVCDHCDGKGVL